MLEDQEGEAVMWRVVTCIMAACGDGYVWGWAALGCLFDAGMHCQTEKGHWGTASGASWDSD